MQTVCNMQNKLKTEYAFVSGATSGIGLSIAVKLQRCGFRVIACGRNADILEKLKRKYGMIPYVCDLTNGEALNKLTEFLKGKNITVAVNSAGRGNIGYFEDISDSDDTASISLNVTALQMLTKFFAAEMKRGVILNVCSAAAFSPEPLMATYAATKAYVYSYSRAVDYELERKGKPIRVLLLCPAAVNTPFIAAAGACNPAKGISSDKCANEAVKAIFSKKSVIVPLFSTKVLRVLSRIAPEFAILSVQYKYQKEKLRK